MDDTIKKNAIIRSMMEIECYPINEEEAAVEKCTRIPIEELSIIGASFSSIAQALENIVQSAPQGEPLFRMNLPGGLAPNERISLAKDGSVLGNIVDKNTGKITRRATFEANTGSSRAIAPIDPTMMFMATAISVINQKLDSIEEAQKDIMEFLQLKEKAVLKGNIAVLKEILEEYKFNVDNEKYKNHKHIQVQEIKRDAEQSIILCRGQIEKRLGKKGWLHSDQDVKSKMQKIRYDFNDYELAMYIFAFSSFLEVMLLENFDTGYLQSVKNKIHLYADQYRELHKTCYDTLKSESESSLQSKTLNLVAKMNSGLGKIIANIPKIGEGQMDEALINAGEKVRGYSERRVENTMEIFAREECTCIRPFVENIETVDAIYNKPMDMLFDGKNIYIRTLEPVSENA